MLFSRDAPMTVLRSMTHLEELEAESIYIMREVAAQFRKPLMLFGKDSSVMLNLAMKAFWPSKPPFPLLHIDTTWKFKEMIALECFRYSARAFFPGVTTNSLRPNLQNTDLRGNGSSIAVNPLNPGEIVISAFSST
jgi:hypothetical protein